MGHFYWDPPDWRIDRVEESCRDAERVLDVGGWWKPLRCATHVIDINPYETRGQGGWIGKGTEEQFSESTWTRMDICSGPFPYSSDYFDFVYCGQTLEDVRDPVGVCREIIRVGKSGLIEVPSIWIECQYGVDAAPESSTYPGYERHRWLVQVTENGLVFIPKLVWLNGLRFTSPEESARLRTDQSLWTDELWWEEDFDVSELPFAGRNDILPILQEYFSRYGGTLE